MRDVCDELNASAPPASGGQLRFEIKRTITPEFTMLGYLNFLFYNHCIFLEISVICVVVVDVVFFVFSFTETLRNPFM